ncbi:MAG: hypothetical protein KF762_17610 [Acidobacteria bacterium]|nr:hypothetical protein [Acidobacteriota bacterium]
MGNRAKVIETITARLSMPRLQISAILALTALSAFIVSAVLLRLGVTEMALRYPVAVIAGYIVFLLLLRVWIYLNTEETLGTADLDGSGDLALAALDGLDDIGVGGSAGGTFGGGGDFAGAGAGGDWGDAKAVVPVPVGFSSGGGSSSLSSGSGSGGGLGSFDFDLDEGLALLLVAVVLIIAFSAIIYVVWIAPILFAELLVDAAVVGSLYKPVKNIERSHWLMTALKKTGIPALVVLTLFAIAGFIMQAAVPEAVTIGEFFESVLG